MAKKLPSFFGRKSEAFYDFSARSAGAGFACVGPSLTRQSERDEADINVLVRRFGVTGQLPQVLVPPSYGDFTGVSDYKTALLLIKAADESFAGLSAEVRRRFDNDPAKLVAFCEDSKNLDELRKLGLAVPAKEPPKATEPVPPATAPAGGISSVK